MTTWTVVVVLTVGTVLFKTVGPVLAGGRQPPARLSRVIALLVPALVTSLVVADTFTDHQTLVVDARAVGLAVGAVALWRRAPAMVALVLAAVVCAAVRALV